VKNLFRSIWSRIRPPAGAFTHANAGNLETDKWSASDAVLRLQRVVGKRPYPLDELLLMTAAFRYLQPTVVVEIGTHVDSHSLI